MRDENGLKIKPGHTGNRGPAIGPLAWLAVRHDGKMFGPFEDRHGALSYCVHCENRSADDYEPVAVPAGSFRFDDVITREAM